MNKSLLAIVEHLLALRNCKDEVQIFPHVRVDGDALGSALALALSLQRIQIPAHIYCDEPVPERLLFLNLPKDIVTVFDPEKLSYYAERQEAAMAVDCSEANRMGKSGTLFALAKEPMVIDHHVSSGVSDGLKHVAPHAAATAEIAYEVISELERSTKVTLLDAYTANCLMVGLQADTGRFSYQNTTAKTLRVAAALLEAGANVHTNAYNLFDITDAPRMRLTSTAMINAHFLCKGKLVWTKITKEMIQDSGASDDAADGLVSNLRDVKGVLVSLVIRETASEEVRVNIRSHSPFDSAAFATAFGGGGHQRAAGFSMTGKSIDDVCRIVLEKAGEILSQMM